MTRQRDTLQMQIQTPTSVRLPPHHAKHPVPIIGPQWVTSLVWHEHGLIATKIAEEHSSHGPNSIVSFLHSNLIPSTRIFNWTISLLYHKLMPTSWINKYDSLYFIHEHYYNLDPKLHILRIRYDTKHWHQAKCLFTSNFAHAWIRAYQNLLEAH